MHTKQCKECYRWFNTEDESNRLCSDCFENAVEQHEIDKRRRIAESLEY